jgi:hypothetical protein
MKNILKFIGLKVLEIGSFIYIPYGLGVAGKEAFINHNNIYMIWLEGWLVLLGIVIIIGLAAVISWAILSVLCLLAKAFLIWIHWNWRWATGLSQYEKGGTLELIEFLYDKLDDFMHFIHA